MSYKDLTAEERYGHGAIAGDTAEEKVRQFMASIDRPVQDFGPKHVPTERAQAMSWTPKIRHTPDFLGWGKFIETQGCWSDHVIMKPEKLEALLEWNLEMPVWLAIYIQKTDEVIICPLETAIWACHDPRSEAITLDEGTRGEKLAYKVPLEVLLEIRVGDAFALDRSNREKAKKNV